MRILLQRVRQAGAINSRGALFIVLAMVFAVGAALPSAMSKSAEKDTKASPVFTTTRNAPPSPKFVTPQDDYYLTVTSGASIVPGTDDTGNHFDDGVTTIALPFAVQFYDETFTSANVSSNGNLQFTSSNGGTKSGCFPVGSAADVIAPYWTDLLTCSTANGGGYCGVSPDTNGIFTSISGTAPGRTFNIEWRTGDCCGNANEANFEIRLYEGQKRIDFVYGTMTSQQGSLAGVAIQRDTGSQFTAVSCNVVPTQGTQYTFVAVPQVVLTPSSVIGGSGSWPSSPWNSGPYDATRVADNQGARGEIDESSAGNFWLGKQNDTQEDFVIDLGATYNLDSVVLYNTHNYTNNDRATGNFEIYTDNAVAPNTSNETGAGGMDLVNPTLAIQGTLDFPGNPISPQIFSFPPGTTARYLRFNALSMASPATMGVGLNEIQVYGTATACTSPPSGMVSWWPGENNGDDIVSHNNLSLGPATFTTGKVGQAFSFDGSGFASAGRPSNLINMGNQVTIDGWINPSSGSNTNEAVYFGKPTSGGNDYDLFCLFGPVCQLTGAIKTNGVEHFLGTGINPPADTWSHVALTYDGSTMTVYLNGVNVASQPVTGNIDDSGQSFDIAGGDGLNFAGLIDEVEVFNTALSASDIAAIYNAGSFGKCHTCTPPPPNMAGWWPGDGSTRDLGGGSNGVLIGGATFATGEVGQAFSFDGSSGFVQVPNDPAWNFGTADFTIDTWVNFNSAPASPVAFVGL